VSLIESYNIYYLVSLVDCCLLLVSWRIRVEGAVGTIYEGEEFMLQFKFSPKYPFESPEVSLSLFIGCVH
jgi:ubiquitin-protein ligase